MRSEMAAFPFFIVPLHKKHKIDELTNDRGTT